MSETTIKQAVVEVKKLSQSEKAQMLYDDRQKALWIEKDILKTAIKKEKKETAIKLIEMGDTIEKISIATGLSIKEIEKLKK